MAYFKKEKQAQSKTLLCLSGSGLLQNSNNFPQVEMYSRIKSKNINQIELIYTC